MIKISLLLLLLYIIESVFAIPIDGNYNFERGSSKNKNTILGINRWVFIGVVAFPFVIMIICIWCWCIGRNSAKKIEERKRERYIYEHKQNTHPHKGNKRSSHNVSDSDTSSTAKKIINPQKEVEEEVGRRGVKSLFDKKKIYEEEPSYDEDESSIDLATLKLAKSPMTSSPVIKEKPKKVGTPTLLNFENEKNHPRRPKKINATAAVAAKMDPTVPSSPKASSISSFETSSINSNQSNGSKKKGGKKKKNPKKKRESALANETLNTNSSASLHSPQIGMSPVLNSPSTPYYNGVTTPMSPQLYYQQMYNNAAAQVPSVPNPYFTAYNQSPYYGASGVNVASTLTNPYNTSPYLGVKTTTTKTKTKK